jgi:hypothetical protein
MAKSGIIKKLLTAIHSKDASIIITPRMKKTMDKKKSIIKKSSAGCQG